MIKKIVIMLMFITCCSYLVIGNEEETSYISNPIEDALNPTWENQKDSEQSSFDSVDVSFEDTKSSEVKIYYWDREGEILFGSKTHTTDVNNDPSIVKTSNSLTQDYGDTKVKAYTKECDSEYGCFEYELILNSIPDNNVFTFEILSEGLEYYYQPALNAEGENNCNATHCWEEYKELEKERIITGHRPENVVGSYAVYHESKRDNKYRAGKVFHIYRPKIIDYNGDWIWAEMNITNNKMIITIDNRWLERAAYPVIIDPTFGKKTVGGSVTSSLAEDDWIGSDFVSPSNLSAFGNCTYYSTAGFGGGYLKSVLVLNSTLNILSNGVSNEIALPYPVGWVTPTWGTKPSMSSNTAYVIGFIVSGSGSTYYYDHVSQANWFDGTNSYATPTNPTDATKTDSFKKNDLISAYCSYTVAVDSTNPVVKLIKPPDNINTTNTTYVFSCNATDNTALKNLSIWHNIGGTWKANYTVAASGASNTSMTISKIIGVPVGSYKWSCRAFDNALNKAFATSNRTVMTHTKDTTKPIITLISPSANNITSSSTPVLTGKCSDNVASNVGILLIINGSVKGSKTCSNATNCGITVNSALTDGNYNWSFRCNDTTNNTAYSIGRNISIDRFSPLIGLISPENNNITSNKTPKFTAVCNDSMASNMAALLIINGSVKGSKTCSNATNCDITSNELSLGR